MMMMILSDFELFVCSLNISLINHYYMFNFFHIIIIYLEWLIALIMKKSKILSYDTICDTIHNTILKKNNVICITIWQLRVEVPKCKALLSAYQSSITQKNYHIKEDFD